MRDIDVKSYALGYDSGSKTGGGYPEPSGTKNISSNGDYNIKDYATAHVDVPQGITPTGTRTITQNGVYNVTEYASADVQVEESTTSLTDLNATANGTYNHDGYDGYDQVVVNVPNPSTGTLNITSNGDYDVTSKATAHVAVPEPTPVAPDLVDLTVTENGTYTHTGHDGYDEVVVNVPQGSTPTGSINITSNGTTDVTNYASAVVNVANSYSNSDEDKVVHNGALVTQTSATKTANGTYDTTLNNEIIVNVPGSGVPQTGCTLRKNMSPRYFAYDIYGYENYYYTSTSIYKAPPIAYVGLGSFESYIKKSNYTWKVELVFKDEGHQVEYIPDKWAWASTSPALSKISQVSVVLPDDIKIIGKYAFSGIPLKSIYLKNVEWIYSNAFAYSGLTSVTIPSSVKGIGGYAFQQCASLQTVIFKGTPSSTIEPTIFADCPNLSDIYVPWSNGEVAGAPWCAENATVHYNYSA